MSCFSEIKIAHLYSDVQPLVKPRPELPADVWTELVTKIKVIITSYGQDSDIPWLFMSWRQQPLKHVINASTHSLMLLGEL